MSFRNPMIAKIKIAQKQLGLDDASYREMLLAETGKRSTTLCSEAELERVLGGLAQRGFRTISAPKQRKPYVKLIYKLWGELERAGALADPSVTACASFVQRQTGISRPEWLGPDEANKVIEGLKAWLARSKREQQ